MIELLLVCLVTGLAAGIIGATKGRSGFGWFVIGFLLNIIGVLIAIGVPSVKPVVIAGAMPHAVARRGKDLILCHACGRPHRVDAPTCPHCHAGPPDPYAGQKKCYACAEWILSDAIKCKHCGEMQVTAAKP